MYKFKVGDRVIATNSGIRSIKYTAGMVGTVKSINDFRFVGNYEIEFDNISMKEEERPCLIKEKELRLLTKLDKALK